MSFRQTAVAGLPALALRSELVELVVVPAAGMRITHLRRHRGREWLWHNPDIPLAPPRRGASYAETADSGGWDDCFPTVTASPVPGRDPAVELPDHGELWQLVWTASVFDHAQGTTFRAVARGERLPYEFTREVALDPHEPVVRFRYAVVNTGDTAFPWIWSPAPRFAVQPGTTVELPVRQVRVGASHGRPDLEGGDVASWPGAVGGEADRFTFPDASAGWALQLFGDTVPPGRSVITDPREGERLELQVDAAEVPQVGVWIDCGGWAPAGVAPYYHLGVQPRIGAPDRLDEAVDSWRTAAMLEPGAEQTWGVDVTLRLDAD